MKRICIFLLSIFAAMMIYAQITPCLTAASVGAMPEVRDSIVFSQLYATEQEDASEEVSFTTEELTTQSHDGQAVFCNKRKVEYRIKPSKGKVTVKRRVLSSENSVACEDRKVQEVYPDVTEKLLSGVLTPKKIKTDGHHQIPVSKRAGDEDEGVLVIDKLSQLPVKEETVMGVRIKYCELLEELHYASKQSMFFDKLKAVQSRIVIEQTNKDGEKHLIQLNENIHLLW